MDLPGYQNKLIFERFFFADSKKNSEVEEITSKQKFALSQLGQKVNHAKNAKELFNK